MAYAVMQTVREPPLPEQLSKAFRQVPGLTAMDVSVLGKDAFGVLVKGFELERALTLQSVLAAEGVKTEVVNETALMELPSPALLAKVNIGSEALQVDDLMGHVVSLEWNDILVIAAGRVLLTDFISDIGTKLAATLPKDAGPKVVLKAVKKEEKKEHLLLEIITQGAAKRFHAKADRAEAQLLFKCLGDRRSKDPASNLLLFVQELAKSAPDAVLNCGAYYMAENNDTSFFYPSPTAFYREITWLLWMVSANRPE